MTGEINMIFLVALIIFSLGILVGYKVPRR